MKIKQNSSAALKAADDGGGIFEGYASVFGNVDSYGDVVERGAFADSLTQWAKSGKRIPIYFGHRTDDPEMNIGHVVEAVEDEHGLRITGQLDMAGTKAVAAYRALKEQRLSEMSFGYLVNDSEQKSDHLLLKSVELLEVSVVPVGANRATSIENVKAGTGHNEGNV